MGLPRLEIAKKVGSITPRAIVVDQVRGFAVFKRVAGVRWVSGRTPGGGVTAESALLDLEPSGRQFDFELVYARPWAGGEAHLAAIATHDAGHVRDEHEAALLARYRHPF